VANAAVEGRRSLQIGIEIMAEVPRFWGDQDAGAPVVPR